MKPKYILFLTVLTLLVAFVFYFIQSDSNQQVYALEILKERSEKNDFMRNAPDSPFGDARTEFDSLNYFVPDINFKIVADLEPIKNKQTMLLPTSANEEKTYLEYAYANFKFNGIENKLLILELIDQGPYRGTLFLAFADLTSGAQTYGAGRYLDLKKIPGANTITLDFNKAYNPYCAYSPNFSCPFPPKQNSVNIAIRAGEKNYR